MSTARIPTPEEDTAELLEAFRATSPRNDHLAIDHGSVTQEQVVEIAYVARNHSVGRSGNLDRARQVTRSVFSDELRRIGLIPHGARVEPDSVLDRLLDEMVSWALRYSYDSTVPASTAQSVRRPTS